ncbi:MAG: diaminopimelate epimerase [Planctomycetota bacterium]|jgi:diaminopimelate epimerase
MKFTKMHGLGNDYVFVNIFDQRVDDPARLARAVADRRRGIGGDGLILIAPSEAADVRMVVYNVDGSRAEMCGNGVRCVAKYAVDHGLASGSDVRIETDAGTMLAECHTVDGGIRTVRVDMGRPSLAAASLGVWHGFATRVFHRLKTGATLMTSATHVDRIVNHPMEVGGSTYAVTCVSMGNPHVVIFVEDLDAVALERTGPLFERASVFPQRINAHFVRVDSLTHVTMKTWERGSGATNACGTGACAVCVAGAVTERTERTITATLPGGDLQVEWSDDDHVYMTGPAVEVFSGVW